MPWFIKTERLLRPHREMKPLIEEHRRWVKKLRDEGMVLSSGYLVDSEGQPGGGGLLLLQADDYREAEMLIQQDPMVLSGGVEWTLQQWRPAVGDLGVI